MQLLQDTIFTLGTPEYFSHHVTTSLLIKRTGPTAQPVRTWWVTPSSYKHPKPLEAQLPEAPPLFAVHGEYKRPWLGEDVMSFIRPKWYHWGKNIAKLSGTQPLPQGRRGHVGPSGKSSCFILQGAVAAPVPQPHPPACLHILQQLIIIPASPWLIINIYCSCYPHAAFSRAGTRGKSRSSLTAQLRFCHVPRQQQSPRNSSTMTEMGLRQDRSDPHGFLFLRRGCWHVPRAPVAPANCHSSSDSSFSGCTVTLSSVTQGYQQSQKMWLKADWVIRASFWVNLCHSYMKSLKRREGKSEMWAKWSHVWAHHFQEPTGSFIL